MSNRWYVCTQVGANYSKKPPRAEKEVGGVVRSNHSVGVEYMWVAMVSLLLGVWYVNYTFIKTCSCILSSGASNFPFKLQCCVES